MRPNYIRTTNEMGRGRSRLRHPAVDQRGRPKSFLAIDAPENDPKGMIEAPPTHREMTSAIEASEARTQEKLTAQKGEITLAIERQTNVLGEKLAALPTRSELRGHTLATLLTLITGIGAGYLAIQANGLALTANLQAAQANLFSAFQAGQSVAQKIDTTPAPEAPKP